MHQVRRFQPLWASLRRQTTLAQAAYAASFEVLLKLRAAQHAESSLVRNEHYSQTGGRSVEPYVRRVALEPPAQPDRSLYRAEDNLFLQGESAEEARLHPATIEARVDSLMVRLPPHVAQAVANKVLGGTLPLRLRERAALIYHSLEKEQIQRAPELPLDADAHVAALFLQGYAHARRVLLELQKRVASFAPQAVLDVGYGPATGMVALNEILGTEHIPKVKEAYVVGRANKPMKDRARLILDSQPAEANPEHKTRLRDALPSTKQYDLIMVNQAMLSREYNFPKDVDVNLHLVLRLLKPDGHLVIIERGNALGFEIVARARQVMLRPEAHAGETRKIPRPYIKGSTYKPQKLRREDQMITSEHVRYEEQLLARLEQQDAEVSPLEQEILDKHGPVSEQDLAFELEDDPDFEVADAPAPSASQFHHDINKDADYHLSVVAPCPHHGTCPLQLGDPKFYRISGHTLRLLFCSFNQTVERPRYTMELKRGKQLATAWDKNAPDGFGTDQLSRSFVKKLAGTGRRGSGNSEAGNLSYLIMHRLRNDEATVAAIREAREHKSDAVGAEPLPRVLDFPSKVKKNVKLKVCAALGNVEQWQVPKSFGRQAYHDARKSQQGDLWALGRKSAVVKSRLLEAKLAALQRLANTQRKFVVKEKRKRENKKLVSQLEAAFDDPMDVYDEAVEGLERLKKYRAEGKRAQYDVDLRAYDGK